MVTCTLVTHRESRAHASVRCVMAPSAAVVAIPALPRAAVKHPAERQLGMGPNGRGWRFGTPNGRGPGPLE